jgi:cytochrome b
MATNVSMRSVTVWDLPTRLFHWALVLLVLTSWASVSLNWMQLHFLSGYSVATLLLFRLGWGLIGSDTARFGNFLHGPIAAFHHLAHLTRREPDREIGHNAAGGWMVLFMLLLLAVQVGTGLCANDDVMLEGPFANFVGKPLSDRLTIIHHVNFNLIEAAILLHLAAILTYAVLKRHNLVWPMITGRKWLPPDMAAPALANPLKAFALLAAVVVVVTLAVKLL